MRERQAMPAPLPVVGDEFKFHDQARPPLPPISCRQVCWDQAPVPPVPTITNRLSDNPLATPDSVYAVLTFS